MTTIVRADSAPTTIPAQGGNTAVRPMRPKSGLRGSGFRPDIEGLRAIAVGLVIANHVWGVPTGGFLGVDVFFVISGFLITGLLVREFTRDGTVSFTAFYRRRAWRILPAAVLVIAVTVGVGFLLLSAPRALSVATSGLWSLLFAENWHLVATGADYFQAEASQSPLEHYWSLAVEEQFYLLWPLLVLLLLTLAARRRRGGSARVVLLSLAGLSAVSFAFSTVSALRAPSFAYFDTAGRVWEFGVGAMIVVTATVWHRIPEAARPLLAWTGLGLLALAVWLVRSSMPLPAPTAVLAVAGVALFLCAGTRQGGRMRGVWPLTNPVTRYVGRISYSLYLWHFPVIVYLGIVFGQDNPLLAVLAVAGTLLLSIASYHLVEEPLRTLGARRIAASTRSAAAVTSAGVNTRKLLRGTLIVGGAAAAALVVVAAVRVAPTPVATAAVPVSVGAAASGDAQALAAQRTEDIQAALRTTSWPALTPSVADFGDNGRAVVAPEWEADGCLGLDGAQVSDPQQNALRCVYGDAAADAAHTAVVFGDSIAVSYAPMIRQALGDQWAVKLFTVAGCPASSAAVVKVDGGQYPECDAFRAWAIDQIRQTTPGLVFVAEATDNNRLASGADGDAAVAEWTEATRTTLQQLVGAESHLVMLTRPSKAVSLYDCQTAISTPQDCVAPVELGFERRNVALREVVEETDPGFVSVNTLSWFCSQGQCPAFIGTVPSYADGIHLTAAAATAAAPLLAAEIAGLLPADATTAPAS